MNAGSQPIKTNANPRGSNLITNSVRNWAGCWAEVITLADDLVSHYQLFKYTLLAWAILQNAIEPT